MSKFPKDNPAALKAFYGDPADHGPRGVAAQLVHVVPPFQMRYDGKPMRPNQLLVHQKFEKEPPANIMTEFGNALQKIWDYFGHDQAILDKQHITWNSGTYAPRMVRGSQTKWSNHAFGAAWDVDAEDNPLGSKNNKLSLVVVAAFKSEGASWGGDYQSRKDNMHVEFCDRGEPKMSFEQWLAHYNQPPQRSAPQVAAAPPPAPAPIPPFLQTGGTQAQSASPDGPVRGDPEIWNVQRRLKAMNYAPGDLDGVWGGQTSGAISGFVNDRPDAKFSPPTSREEFLGVLSELKAALGQAESEHFVRPVSVARAMATEAQVAEKMPELAPVRKNKLAMIWAGVTASVGAVFNAVVGHFQDALSYLQPVREFFAEVPGWVWFGVAIAAAYYIYRNSSLSASKMTESFQKGERP